MRVPRKLLLFSLLSFLIFGFAHQARAESAGIIQTVPQNYALVGFGYGSDDKACTLEWKEGRLNIDGTVGEVDADWHQAPCVDAQTGENRYGDDPMPGSKREQQAPANSYLTGWTWDASTSGGSKLPVPPWYLNGSPKIECFFQMYQQFDPITKKMIGPIKDFGSTYDGTCNERGYTKTVLQRFKYATPGKVLVAIGLSLGNDGDVNYVTISSRPNIPTPWQTVSGKVYDSATGLGIKGASIFLCYNGISVTTAADGTFSSNAIPAGASYCVRNDSDPYPGYTGPTLNPDYTPDPNEPGVYTGQYDAISNGGRDRPIDTGYTFAYTPIPPTVQLWLAKEPPYDWQNQFNHPAPVPKIVDLKGLVTNGSGPIDWYFWCDNPSDGHSLTPPPKDSYPAANYNPAFDYNLCDYPSTIPNTYTPKVLIKRNGQWAFDHATVIAGTAISVSLSATPPGGIQSQLVKLTAVASTNNPAAGTFNYSIWFDCNNSTNKVDDANNDPTCGRLPAGVKGICVTNAYGMKCDGIPSSITTESVDHTYTYTGTGLNKLYNPKVILEQDGATPFEKRTTVTMTPDTPPDTPLVTLTAGDYCVIPSEIISWTYNDTNNNPPNPPNNDPQSQYELIIASNNAFVNPEIDWKKSSNATQDSVIVSSNPTPGQQLAFNTTYYVRVKVWDTIGPIPNTAPSVTKTFATPIHAYPWPSFTWSPASPKAGKPVTFTNTTALSPGSINQIWGWIFCANGNQCKIPTSTQRYPPSNTYYQSNTYNVSLRVTDDAGTCSKTNPVPVGNPFIPTWKEIAPF